MRARMGVTVVSKTWKSRGRVRRVYRVVGSYDEANQTLSTIVISNGETPEPNRTDNNDSKDELPPGMSPKKGCLSRSPSSHAQCRVCQQDKEEVLIDLGCQCRGGHAKAHRSCIDTWFRTRGSNRCEICQ
ncbi:hypothetical protein Dsin_012636 [Dipteronia sinensis]|uniref:RING-CH-type domain-containing protein n=1 Tax=Dipteronia sinensis TaxID=43782 RepID=A0AAE0AIE8_9ROSI|nr:hypothetical protein Dsin_012636 [Dipteronia sinensis]